MKQMKAIKEKVYDYYGINEKIIKSSYNEEEFNAFYESILEPLAIQMSLAFTNCLFTDREKGHGNQIIFEANRLQYASNTTKINIVTTLMDRGMMTKNQGLEVFNMPPIEGGDKRILSLNFIDADKANEYQVGKQDPKVKEGDEIDSGDDGEEIE
jgi:hypothetical protein